MTIGEKLLEHFQYKNIDGEFDFKYITESNGMMVTKSFKGRLDHEFVTTEDGKDYSSEDLEEYNIGVSLRQMTDGKGHGLTDNINWVFKSMLQGIAVRKCKMLSPIHIYTEERNDGFYLVGKAMIDEKSRPMFERLKYPETV